MKKIILLFSCSLALISCVICSSRSSLYIKNCTNDSILICTTELAKYNIIDSVKFFLEGDYNSDLRTEFKDSIGQKFGSLNIIPPDSSGCYVAVTASNGTYMGVKLYERGFFFIIKLETSRNHTWEEICRNHLYDTLVVTQEMLEQTGNIIEYKAVSAILDSMNIKAHRGTGPIYDLSEELRALRHAHRGSVPL